MRVKRGGDIASDHHLLVARLKLKLKRNWNGGTGQRQRFNTGLLKDTDKLEEYRLALTNRFQVLQELLEEESIDEQWKAVKETVTSTCQEVLGYKTRSHKE